MLQISRDDLSLELELGELVRFSEEEADSMAERFEHHRIAHQARAKEGNPRSAHVLGHVWFLYGAVEGNRYREYYLD